MNSCLFSIFKRKFIPSKVFYKTKASQSKLKDPNQLPSSASNFKKIHREALNIHYKNVYSANEILNPLPENFKINNDLFVSNFTKEDLLTFPGSSIWQKLANDEERSLAKYLNDAILNEQLSKKIRETFTDTLVNYFFAEFKLNKYPFTLRLQSDFGFSISDKDIIAKSKTEYGESQISAEILACAFTNFRNIESPTFKMDQTVYAIRVIGTRFTFYKVFLSIDYCEFLENGFPPKTSTVTIIRFPPNDKITFYGYNYADKNHRCLILDLLYRLKECLLKI
ncbi:hypothetical protein Glove_363g14 [Diversispora epigaea]|uniref:Uncharacterized protein n=1 Tax=Diversispora epigaea TaxID=1348612 RepID=A0A397HC41_9GLOM|nr:hypothetical protein Glove_363g14 [Diversispora epigaea]